MCNTLLFITTPLVLSFFLLPNSLHLLQYLRCPTQAVLGFDRIETDQITADLLVILTGEKQTILTMNIIITLVWA